MWIEAKFERFKELLKSWLVKSLPLHQIALYMNPLLTLLSKKSATSLSVALRKSDIFYHCDYCEAWQNLGWSVYLIKINVKPKCWKKPCEHACYIQLTTTVYGWWRTGHQRPTPNMRCPIRTWTQWQAANCQQILLTATRILELTWGFAYCQRISVAIRPWSLRQAFTSCWIS